MIQNPLSDILFGGDGVKTGALLMETDKKIVVLCTSRIYEPQIHGFIVRLNELLTSRGYNLFVFSINSDIYWEEDRQATEKYVFDLIPYDFVQCIIIMDEKIKSHKIANKIIAKSNEKNIPVVIADGHYDNTSTINFDYEQGFELVVRHVIEYHHVKKPHMMAGQPDNEFSNRRIDVFKKVLADNGIPYDDSMISFGYFWADPCRKATEEILSRDELPEAIICANDVMAITVSEMLSESGYKVPDDVIVTGFDGYDGIYFTSPKITTASCDIILLAEATAEEAFQVMENHKEQHHKIVPEFISNESCGCHEYTAHTKLLRDWFRESFSRHNDDNRVLQQITSSMQTSTTPGEMVQNMESYKTENVLCAIDRNCFDVDNNYFTDEAQDNPTKDFILIYDSDYTENYKKDTFTIPEPQPGFTEDVLTPAIRGRMFELLESGYPLIFNSLDFMNRPFGFICYHFNDYLISNYSNIVNATNAISIGVGGYVNIQYQRTLLERMDEMYRHDSLTGLFNRIGFLNIFKRTIKKPEYRDKPITVIMSDLDGLKYINDRFGHADGDNAIYRVANALQTSVPESSLSARFGGDEVFSVIFGECDPDQIIKKINKNLEEYNIDSGKAYDVSTSCGYITTTLDDSFDLTQAIKDADEKMYAVKNSKTYPRG